MLLLNTNEQLDQGRRKAVDGYASACTHSPLLSMLPENNGFSVGVPFWERRLNFLEGNAFNKKSAAVSPLGISMDVG